MKPVIRDVLKDELSSKDAQAQLYKELVVFEAEIDALALRCFDVYTECRERISQIRVNEVKNQSARLLKMAGLVCEIGGEPEVSEKAGE